MSLLVQNYALISPDLAILSAFLSGLIILAMGLFNLGFLVHFISIPVTVGFTTAAAFSIGSLQVKSLLGLPGRSTEFVDAWIHVFNNIGQTRLWDTVLGLSSIAFLVALKVNIMLFYCYAIFMYFDICIFTRTSVTLSMGNVRSCSSMCL